MIPGEIKVKNTDIEINQGHPETVLTVKNTGDRPIQVGSHFHFYEANKALKFEREKAYGKHLDIPAGAAVRFEPGDEKKYNLLNMLVIVISMVSEVWSMAKLMKHASIALLVSMMAMLVSSMTKVKKTLIKKEDKINEL